VYILLILNLYMHVYHNIEWRHIQWA